MLHGAAAAAAKKTEVRRFACLQCPKRFKLKHHLKAHVAAVHENLRPYKCENCGACFATQFNLDIHIDGVHNNNRRYKCGQCDSAFTQAGNLKTHIDRVHNDLRPFMCADCDFAAAANWELDQHINIVHNKLKLFRCDQCDAEFSCGHHLRSHKVSVHDKTRNHHCTQCPSTFALSNTLRKHEKEVHDKIRKHACSQCSGMFVRPATLKLHVEAVHQNLKAYKCHFPDCNMTFTYPFVRDLHEKRVHVEGNNEAYVKKKEEWVVGFCKEREYAYDREVFVTYKGCGEDDTCARLDFVIYKEEHLLILSVDEFQHCDREVVCEVARMSKVVCSIRQAGDTRPVCWIRFNPDSVRVNGESVRIPLKIREDVLERCIDTSDELIGGADVAVYYLYYDCTSNEEGDYVADVVQHVDYDEHWRPVVKGCIVG